VLNPGTGHKKVKSVSGVFQEGGTMVFDTQTKEQNKILYLSHPYPKKSLLIEK
jgi:hypothetical protein